MGKAKMFGGAAVVFGLVMGLISMFVVKSAGLSFTAFLLYTYLPVLLVTIGLIAIVIGILLLIYG